MHVDIRTVAVVSIYITLILGLLMVYVWRTRKTYSGFARWTIGNLLAPSSLALLSMRGILPDWTTIVLANTCTIVASILLLEGTREFRGLRPRLVSAYVGGCLTVLCLIYFRYVVNDISMRITAVSLYLAISTLGCAVTLLKNIPERCKHSMRFSGAVFLLVGGANFIRAVYFSNHPFVPGLFVGSLLNAVYFLNTGAASIAWCFGFLLITNDRLVMGLKDAELRAVSANRELEIAIERANRMAARAAEADAAKTDFLAHMSHEIRTPLNGVIGMTSLVLDGPLTEQKRPDLLTVQNSAESLLDIINDILDLSKIEAGQLMIRMGPVDLRRTLEQIVELFRPQANAKGVRLALVYPDETQNWFSADAVRLRQIVSNFTANAVKFTFAGEILVGIEQRHSMIRIWVRDTGIGIDPEMLPLLFSKFTQVHTSSQHYGGTGLGLAISKNLAELMSGTVGVSSERGRGSTFWVELPLAPVAKPAFEAVRGCRSLACDLKSARVLVAEDNAVNQRLLVRILEKQGCAVDAVSTGTEVLQYHARTKYHLILMDCQMPGLDGRETARQIRMRERENSTRTPIIAITANVMPGELDRCLEAGMDDCLNKPINPALLFECIAGHLSKANPGSPKCAINSESGVQLV